MWQAIRAVAPAGSDSDFGNCTANSWIFRKIEIIAPRRILRFPWQKGVSRRATDVGFWRQVDLGNSWLSRGEFAQNHSEFHLAEI